MFKFEIPVGNLGTGNPAPLCSLVDGGGRAELAILAGLEGVSLIIVFMTFRAISGDISRIP